jgi:AraC-like DNA-binding protein/mannose-6-phosphate isomerase-like protein (cupin superfamily)
VSRSHYRLEEDLTYTVRGNAKLLNASRAKYGGDWHSVPHTHTHTELFYIIGGKGQFLIEDHLYPVSSNQLVIINPNVLHTEVSLNAQPLEYVVLGVDGIELTMRENGNGQFCLLAPSESAEISTCLRNILREMELKNTGYKDICQAFTEILIIRLMRSIQLAVPAEPAAPNANHQCASVRRYIDLHFKEPLTLEQLSSRVQFSPSHFHTIFTAWFGTTPHEFVLTCRIDEAKASLRSDRCSLIEIAGDCGFSSQSHFCAQFKKITGQTPLQYRKSKLSRMEP